MTTWKIKFEINICQTTHTTSFILNLFIIFNILLYFSWFLKKKSPKFQKNTHFCCRFHSKILLNNCHKQDFSTNLWHFFALKKYKNNQKVFCLACGNETHLPPWNPVFGRFGFSLSNSVAMHPNGPKCIRNTSIPSLLVQVSFWSL